MIVEQEPQKFRLTQKEPQVDKSTSDPEVNCTSIFYAVENASGEEILKAIVRDYYNINHTCWSISWDAKVSPGDFLISIESLLQEIGVSDLENLKAEHKPRRYNLWIHFEDWVKLPEGDSTENHDLELPLSKDIVRRVDGEWLRSFNLTAPYGIFVYQSEDKSDGPRLIGTTFAPPQLLSRLSFLSDVTKLNPTEKFPRQLIPFVQRNIMQETPLNLLEELLTSIENQVEQFFLKKVEKLKQPITPQMSPKLLEKLLSDIREA